VGLRKGDIGKSIVESETYRESEKKIKKMAADVTTDCYNEEVFSGRTFNLEDNLQLECLVF